MDSIYLNGEKTKILAQTMVNEALCNECKLELVSIILATEIELPKLRKTDEEGELEEEDLLPAARIPIKS